MAETQKKKNQLHQLLAVEAELRMKAEKIQQETSNTFSKKADHFDGLIKTYEPFSVSDEEKQATKIAPEIKEIVTTVHEKLQYTRKQVVPAIDAQISKEETNASATAIAELKVGAQDFGTLSAQSLLSLEKILVRLRKVYASIPTLDPAKAWKLDEANPYTNMTEPHNTFRTEKKHKVVTLAPPTTEHPAQTELVNVDEQVGTITTIYKSGKITPREKSGYLGRVDRLLIAVKKARSRANQVEVTIRRVGKKIFDFIDFGVDVEEDVV